MQMKPVEMVEFGFYLLSIHRWDTRMNCCSICGHGDADQEWPCRTIVALFVLSEDFKRAVHKNAIGKVLRTE